MNEYEWNSPFTEKGNEVSYSFLLKCSPTGKGFRIFNLALQGGEKSKLKGENVINSYKNANTLH